MIRNPANAARRNNPSDRDDDVTLVRVRTSRRRPEKRMSEARIEEARQNVKRTKTESRASSTRYNYSSYYPAMHGWYKIHAPELMNNQDELDASKVRAACSTDEGLKEQLKHFENFLESREHIREKLPNGDPAKAKLGTLLGYRTSFGYYVWAKDVEGSLGIPPQWHAGLKSYFAGLKRKDAENKQKGLGRVTEGKCKMCLQLLKQLAIFFHQECKPIASFCNSWAWNLMCRHFNLESISAHHLGFKQDAITVEYAKDKTRPEGDSHNKTAMLKHVFANPFMPEVSVRIHNLRIRMAQVTFTPLRIFNAFYAFYTFTPFTAVT